MPHQDLDEDGVEITIDKNGQVSVRGNNIDNMDEIVKMLAEMGIHMESETC